MENLENTRVFTDAEFEGEIIDGEIEMLSGMIRELMQKRQELDLNLVKIRTVRDRLLSTVENNKPLEEQMEFELVAD